MKKFPTCESCLYGKMTKVPFHSKAERSQNILDIIHSDFCGPMSVRTDNDHFYFVIFIDDFFRARKTYLLPKKS